MNVQHVLICCFFFTLQAGNIGVLAGHRILKGTEGGRITVVCSFVIAGENRFFCKQKCETDVLIETAADRDENGRYKVEYSKTFYLSYPVLYVTITRLSKSDTGHYRCGLGKPLLPDSHEDFELIVEDGAPSPLKPIYTSRAPTPMMTQSLSSSSESLTSSSASPEITEQTARGTAPLGSAPTSSSSVGFTSSSSSPETTEQSEQQQTERATALFGSSPTTSKPNWTFPTSASTPRTTQHLSSSSVGFTSSSSSPETTEQSEQQQTERATALFGSWNLLYVGVALLIMMVVLLVFGLLFRARRRKEYLMKAEYTHGRYTEQNGDNNRTTAAGSQNQATEDLNTIPLLHSAPAGDSSDVNYSTSPPL